MHKLEKQIENLKHNKDLTIKKSKTISEVWNNSDINTLLKMSNYFDEQGITQIKFKNGGYFKNDTKNGTKISVRKDEILTETKSTFSAIIIKNSTNVEETIKELKENNKINQDTIATALGISQPLVSQKYKKIRDK